MKYDWDLIKLLKLAINSDFSQNALNALIEYFIIPKDPEFTDSDYEYIFKEDTSFIRKNQYLLPIIKELNKYRNKITNYAIKEMENAYASMIISKDGILEIAKDFYDSLSFDKEIYEAFLKIYNQRFNHLVFLSNYQKKFSGLTYFCGPNDTYISIYHDGSENEVYSLIHEYGHAIASNIFLNRSKGYKCIKEIEGFFLEMLSVEYFQSKPSQLIYTYPQIIRNTKEEMLAIIDAINNLNDDLLKKLKLLDYEESFISCPSSYNYIKYNIMLKENMSYTEVDNIFKAKYDEDLKYIVSAIISIELVYLYKNDPEKALYIYKKIIRHETENSFEQLSFIKEQGIHPFEHLDEYIRRLER